MIKDIIVKNTASFDDQGQNISGLDKINFFYGANGSGKTTVSRIIDNQDKYTDCSISWESNNRLETFVYNQDFITRNFSPDKKIAGIFTLGEHNADVVESIATAKKAKNDIVKKIKNKKDTLHGEDHGEDGKGGKIKELEYLEDSFAKQCWTYKKKYEDEFKDAFKGDLTKENFKARILNEIKNNNANLFSIEQLEKKAKTVFADGLVEEGTILPVSCDDLAGLENSGILSKKVIGQDDVDIAAMIKKLGNSDWVKQGHAYYNKNEEYCPFCQQKTETAFANSLKKYFDDDYLNNMNAIEDIAIKYNKFSDIIMQDIEDILKEKPKYLNCDKFQAHKDVYEELVIVNKQYIDRKKKEASTIVTLKTIQDVMKEINVEIDAANKDAEKHNNTIDNISEEKKYLTSQIWRFIVEEIKSTLIYKTYDTNKSDIEAVITQLKTDIKDLEQEEKEKSDEIKVLEKKITSIEPTIDAINSLLKSFSFVGFSLKLSEQKSFYKIVRPNGEDVEETLSEGEKTFVTFLYFYHLLQGSNTESGITEDRVVVFDDPVSSLDSDIMFIVSNLIKDIFKETHSKSGNIKQVFVFTHNIYFHKEISFRVKKDSMFWIIKKNSNDRSVIEPYETTNPIESSYELLWHEVQKPNSSTIQNTLRKILEIYFKFIGDIKIHEIEDEFQGKEKIICSSLLSWVHDGSHGSYSPDKDLCIPWNPDTVEKYLKIFKGIFEKSKQIGHYNMMMKIDESDETK